MLVLCLPETDEEQYEQEQIILTAKSGKTSGKTYDFKRRLALLVFKAIAPNGVVNYLRIFHELGEY